MPPGVPPTHQSARARQNKRSTRATLYVPHPDDIRIPELPPLIEKGEEVPWHPNTEDWWQEIWSSPMASEYVEADISGMLRLAILVDEFWRKPSSGLHAEIRIAQQEYGLTPLSRRRLEWTVESAEDAKARGRNRESRQTAPQPPGSDPRLSIAN